MEKGQRHLYLVYAIGVPGIGKSYVINKLKDYCLSLPDTSIRICTSDMARSTTLDEYYKTNNIQIDKLTQEEIYAIEVLNGPKTRAALKADIDVKIKELSESDAVHNIFVLDKNHSNQEVIDTVNQATENHFQGSAIHYSVLTPENFGSTEGEQLYYPFNFDILLIGLIRNLCRKDHLTMKYGPIHSLLSFIGSLQKQVKDPIEGRFPQAKTSYIPVHYYNFESMDAGKADSSKKIVYEELHKLIDDLVEDKRKIPDSADDVVKLVKQLASLSDFATIDDDYVRDLHEKILESKTN